MKAGSQDTILDGIYLRPLQTESRRAERALAAKLEQLFDTTGPHFTRSLKSYRNSKPISEAKMRFTKYHNMIASVFERK